MKLTNNKLLITGGGSGIGLGLTERFAPDNTVIICGRREDVLRDVADRFPSVISRVCDVSVEAERVALFQWIRENHADLNVLVNNAGIQEEMEVTDADFYHRAKTEVDINVLAPVHLASLFAALPAPETIINVTSGLAFVPLTRVPVYSATKAFMRSFTLSLRQQLSGRNIEVIELIPPALHTDLGGPGKHDGQPEVSDFVDAIFRQLADGQTELTYGFSQGRLEGNRREIGEAFARMNGVAKD